MSTEYDYAYMYHLFTVRVHKRMWASIHYIITAPQMYVTTSIRVCRAIFNIAPRSCTYTYVLYIVRDKGIHHGVEGIVCSRVRCRRA